jgi:glycosyltransferase involved in cell wall biosynthesis
MPGGISDYCRQWAMAVALSPSAPTLTVITHPAAQAESNFQVLAVQENWGPSGFKALFSHIEATRPDVVVVQYEPHMYQRRGLAIAFALFIFVLGRRYPILTIAHELYYARNEGLKVQPLGWVQRLSLWPLFGGSARVALTVPDRLARMRRLFPNWAERFRLLGVGNNLNAARGIDVRAVKGHHGIPPDALMLLFLGLAHPSKGLETLGVMLDRLQMLNIQARLLVVGGGHVEHPWAIAAGFLSAPEAEAVLAAADLAVLPLADGASTRRTSLMNALAAGLPVVSTLGVNTDPALFPKEAMRLVAAGDVGAFAAAVAELALNGNARREMGAAGRSLYEACFGWDVLATGWLAILEEAIALKRDTTGD